MSREMMEGRWRVKQSEICIMGVRLNVMSHRKRKEIIIS